MARNVFRWSEIPQSDEQIVIESPFKKVVHPSERIRREREVEKAKIMAYKGPTVEQIQEEATRFKQEFEAEKQEMILNARGEADLVFEEKEKAASEVLQKAELEAQGILEDADAKAKKVVADARKKAKEEKAEIELEIQTLVADAKDKGHTEGYSEGFEKGQEEVSRLVSKLNQIIGGVVSKRKEILEESENQMIDLVLQIASRVVKVISESQKDIVIQNVRSALTKVKSRTDLIIRVNFEDLDMATEKMKELQSSLDKVKNITVLEDATVDPGGCIIETDFGQIDARISSQLREIETKIREMSPITEQEL